MAVLQDLSDLALRQLVSGACQAVGLDRVGDAVIGYLTERFTDHSQKLTNALQNANERAWKAFEVALGGESLWERCKKALASAEDQAFREQIRAFLDISPLTKASAEHAQLFKQALQELRSARSRGALKTGSLAPSELAREAGALARFNDPQALLDAEWRLVDQAAGELRERSPNLWKLLVARPKAANKPSLLVVAVRYYFRREVESDQALFQGLAFAKWEALQETQEKGFAALTVALSRQGQRLEGMLDSVLGLVKEIDVTTKDTNARVRGLEEQIQKLLERLQLQGRELRPGDSMSVRSEGEQQRVRQLVGEYRALPEEQRRQRPELLNRMGVLEAAAGELEDAQKDFQEAARTLSDPKARAEALHNAYRAALERRQWADALAALRQAVALDSGRFSPFPFEKYEPQRILGAGGFGVVFLCRHPHLNKPLVVKSLTLSELDRDVAQVFAEAQALEDLDHPAIIGLRDCDYADTAKSRPFVVMDYFDGVSLEAHVNAEGPLSPEDLLAVAVPTALALKAAHANGILHRDVKPANLLVRRDGGVWQVKLIDFGLALRPASLQNKASTDGPRAQTTTGKSIAGTLHYAAPEQMGQLEGGQVGPHSDVFGFGKTCYFALLNTPEPDDVEKEGLPEPWRKFLSRSTGRKLAHRLADFTVVLAELDALKTTMTAPQQPTAVGPPEAPEEDVKGGRKELTLKVLRRHGLLAEGTEIEVMPDAMSENSSKQDPKVFRARIGKLGSQKSVIWAYDGTACSLTELSWKLDSYGFSWVRPKTYELWRIVGQTDSMWEQAEKVRSADEAEAEAEAAPAGAEAASDLTPPSGVLAEAANVLEEDPRWEVVARPSNCLDFVPKAWLEWLPQLALRGDPRSWIYVRLSWKVDRLLYSVEMTPMSDATKRIEIATKLLDECPGFGFKRPNSREVKNNYSRVSAVATILQWGEDDEPESDAIRAAVKKTLDDLYPKLEKLALVLKPLCQLPASATAVPTDRAYWERRATPEALQATDNLLKIVNEVEPKAVLRYVKNIIGIQADGLPLHFLCFIPQKACVLLQFKLPQSAEADKQLEEAGVEVRDRGRNYLLRISGAINDKQRGVLLSLIRQASAEYRKAQATGG